MLKLRAANLVILGFTDDDLMALARRDPVLVKGSDMDLDVQIAVIGGATEQSLLDDLRALGLSIPPLDQNELEMHGRLYHCGETNLSEVIEVKRRLVERARGTQEAKANSKGGSA